MKTTHYDTEKMVDRIKHQCDALGILQKDLEEKCGFQKGRIAMIRSCPNITIETAIKIAEGLDVSIDWLCGYGDYEDA